MPGIRPYSGQPNKERLIATMRGEPTDRVPNFEILIEDQHVEKLLRRPAGNTLGVGGDPAKGSEAAEGVRPMYPEDYLKLCRIIGQDAKIVGPIRLPPLISLRQRSIKSRPSKSRIVVTPLAR